MKFGSIYKITNKINNKCYIGQTIQSITKRFDQHKSRSLLSATNCAIHNAIKKYGIENFDIEEIYIAFDLDSLNSSEIVLIEQFNSKYPNGYNIDIGGNNFQRSEETCKRISQGLIGRKLKDTTKRKLSKINKGKKLSVKTKEKISQSQMGEKHHFYRKKLTKEHRQKLSESHLGSKNPNYGKPKSDEVKQKLRRANKCISIFCLETGEIFESINYAAKRLGLYAPNINKVLRGERNHTGNLSFALLEDI